ncbi:MAG TPA: hypothetical protein VN541_05210, partial [Tepidisphaeraceae bacterium]|nr:hypothetical protein [Tepidisphaeraceae bacterium]
IRGNTSIGSVDVSGALGALQAPDVNLTGNVTVGGSLQRLTVNGAGGGNTISAAAIGSIVVHGILSDDIQAATIGHVTVGGAISDSMIRASGSIGSVVAAAAADSEVLAGVRSDLDGLPSTAADLSNPAASIKTFTVRGHGAFSNTIVSAGTIGSASLGAVQTANAGTPFGVAAHHVRSVRASVSGSNKSLHNPSTTGALGGDAVVRII